MDKVEIIEYEDKHHERFNIVSLYLLKDSSYNWLSKFWSFELTLEYATVII